MSLPRIGAKMSASAAPAQAPAHRPATSDDHDALLPSRDDQDALLLSKDDQSRSIEVAASEHFDEPYIVDCMDEGCIADE
jgi:hypothetical protein